MCTYDALLSLDFAIDISLILTDVRPHNGKSVSNAFFQMFCITWISCHFGHGQETVIRNLKGSKCQFNAFNIILIHCAFSFATFL